MSGIEVALAVAGAAASAAGAISQGIAANNAAKFQARVANQNAAIARQRAAVEENKQRQQAQKLLGRQRALFANAGVALEGSPLQLQEETAAQSELEALTIRHSGELSAAQERNRATLARLNGRAELTQGYLSAGSTLLNQASKFKYD